MVYFSKMIWWCYFPEIYPVFGFLPDFPDLRIFWNFSIFFNFSLISLEKVWYNCKIWYEDFIFRKYFCFFLINFFYFPNLKFTLLRKIYVLFLCQVYFSAKSSCLLKCSSLSFLTIKKHPKLMVIILIHIISGSNGFFLQFLAIVST